MVRGGRPLLREQMIPDELGDQWCIVCESHTGWSDECVLFKILHQSILYHAFHHFT